MKKNAVETVSGAGEEVSVWGRAAAVLRGHCRG